jgi:hypothetical protein
MTHTWHLIKVPRRVLGRVRRGGCNSGQTSGPEESLVIDSAVSQYNNAYKTGGLPADQGASQTTLLVVLTWTRLLISFHRVFASVFLFICATRKVAISHSRSPSAGAVEGRPLGLHISSFTCGFPEFQTRSKAVTAE